MKRVIAFLREQHREDLLWWAMIFAVLMFGVVFAILRAGN